MTAGVDLLKNEIYRRKFDRAAGALYRLANHLEPDNQRFVKSLPAYSRGRELLYSDPDPEIAALVRREDVGQRYRMCELVFGFVHGKAPADGDVLIAQDWINGWALCLISDLKDVQAAWVSISPDAPIPLKFDAQKHAFIELQNGKWMKADKTKRATQTWGMLAEELTGNSDPESLLAVTFRTERRVLIAGTRAN